LAPVMGSETVAVGMPITSRATPIAAKVGAMMRHVARVRRGGENIHPQNFIL